MNRRGFMRLIAFSAIALPLKSLMTRIRRSPRWLSPRRVDLANPPPVRLSADFEGAVGGSASLRPKA